MTRRACLAALGLLAGACHLDPVPGPGPGPQTAPTVLRPLPTDAAPVAAPGPPPSPRVEAPLVCEDGQVPVPGQWDWVGEWTWCPAYCALAQAGFAYVAPRFDKGIYTRGHFTAPAGADAQTGLRPSYRRFVHPPDLVLGPPAAPAPAAAPPEAPPEAPPPPPIYYYGPAYPAAHRGQPAPLRPRPAGNAERPPPPPRGSGERP